MRLDLHMLPWRCYLCEASTEDGLFHTKHWTARLAGVPCLTLSNIETAQFDAVFSNIEAALAYINFRMHGVSRTYNWSLVHVEKQKPPRAMFTERLISYCTAVDAGQKMRQPVKFERNVYEPYLITLPK